MATFRGTAGFDLIRLERVSEGVSVDLTGAIPGPGADALPGGGGDLRGGEGDNRLDESAGGDVLVEGWQGNGVVRGGQRADVFTASPGDRP